MRDLFKIIVKIIVFICIATYKLWFNFIISILITTLVVIACIVIIPLKAMKMAISDAIELTNENV